MNEPTLHYAQGQPGQARHSRLGQVAFACATASACGITLTMFLISRPIPGPMGSIVREQVAPMFGVAVLLLWLVGLSLAIAALRQRERIRTFAAWALGLCGVMVLLFVMMIVLR